ncbi:hypothetical protein PybrP1_001175 [[Pythium] brassicae (nom. inval.)]|nr:hypothetical protein PybrP1_001175 [[Pythium] brassicae (nom. inval.)]
MIKNSTRLSMRPPLRMAPDDKQALSVSVAELIRASSSEWVSNIFAVPKRENATGKLAARSKWLQCGDASFKLR